MLFLKPSNSEIVFHSRVHTLIKCLYSTLPVPKKSKSEPLKSEEKELTYSPHDVTRDDMQWRTNWHKQHQGDLTKRDPYDDPVIWQKKFRFLLDSNNYSIANLKQWWTQRQEHKNILLQSYIPERNRLLGFEIAAAHFLVHRGAAIKFHGEESWVIKDEFHNYELPCHFDPTKYIEAIDCSEMSPSLYYEGLLNIRGLAKVRWLRLYRMSTVDDWFLDRVGNIFGHCLYYLDLRHCRNFTEHGLAALTKMNTLKILCLDDHLMTDTYEMTCIMLEQFNKNLVIRLGCE